LDLRGGGQARQRQTQSETEADDRNGELVLVLHMLTDASE